MTTFSGTAPDFVTFPLQEVAKPRRSRFMGKPSLTANNRPRKTSPSWGKSSEKYSDDDVAFRNYLLFIVNVSFLLSLIYYLKTVLPKIC